MCSSDLLLGLVPETGRTDHEAVLSPGATVLLYTDGLVERRGEPLDAGLARLAGAAGELRDLGVHQLCDALLDRLAPDAGDDIALVALRAHPQGGCAQARLRADRVGRLKPER